MGVRASQLTRRVRERLKLPAGRSKYGARGCYVDVIHNSIVEARPPRAPKTEYVFFHSRKEAVRWTRLRIMEFHGHIGHLERQVKYILRSEKGEQITTYALDFRYFDIQAGRWRHEDVKGGIRTEAYELKKKWMKADYNIEIEEV